jgi:3-phenylpropionate/cinnamic acid dioxygenase small subunit
MSLDVGTAFLYREAALLDRQQWDDWLALYVPDCVFWVPSFIDETTVTRDPLTEVSHIYYSSRSGLEDRVWRIRSGLSVATIPMPRTMHAVTNIQLVEASATAMTLESNIAVDVFSLKNQTSHRLFGRAEHRLVNADGAWRIARKTVIVLNDYLPSVVDIYSV